MFAAPSASACRVVPAPSADVFELLANPRRHALIDGSGHVADVQPGTPERLSAGARFGMQMRWHVPYKILNEVVEFEEGRRIAWRHFGGHRWRYELEPVAEDRTQVTETFDAGPSRAPLVLVLMQAAKRNQRDIEQTLDRLEEWARSR
jgi:uncharacterized protein YndB with AHSA1/START domain